MSSIQGNLFGAAELAQPQWQPDPDKVRRRLERILAEVWDYKLGNRSTLEWILDQYKEKTPRDPTVRDKFNTYRFADYKEKVIDLLMRVTRVSVETVAITEAMKGARRD